MVLIGRLRVPMDRLLTIPSLSFDTCQQQSETELRVRFPILSSGSYRWRSRSGSAAEESLVPWFVHNDDSTPRRGQPQAMLSGRAAFPNVQLLGNGRDILSGSNHAPSLGNAEEWTGRTFLSRGLSGERHELLISALFRFCPPILILLSYSFESSLAIRSISASGASSVRACLLHRYFLPTIPTESNLICSRF